MTVRRLTAKELERIILRYRKQLEQSNGLAEAELSKMSSTIEARILRNIAARNGNVQMQSSAEIMQFVRRVLKANDEEFRVLLGDRALDTYELALGRARDVAEVSPFSQRTLSRVLEVFDSFEKGLTERRILRTARPYMDRWAGEWSDEWTKTARVLQAQFTRAAATGQSWTDTARAITDDLGRLDIAGRVNPEDFARAFVRTKLTELYNDAGLEIAHDAGIDKFVNVGVPDDRQSEICYLASQVPAQTLEEWERSEFGVPPRHVMNCRCTLVAVPVDLDTRQRNPKFEKSEAKEEVAA